MNLTDKNNITAPAALTSGLLTPEQLSSYLACHPNTVYRFVQKNCPHIKLGKCLRFELVKVLAWLRDGGADPKRPTRLRRPKPTPTSTHMK